jgi:hypothetical protein
MLTLSDQSLLTLRPEFEPLLFRARTCLISSSTSEGGAPSFSAGSSAWTASPPMIGTIEKRSLYKKGW